MTREEALTMIIASIAMEELALSHILNAEGEKLQYILGTLPCANPCTCPQDVLTVNKSVTSLVEAVTQNQMLLKNKLDQVLELCPPPCPAPCPPPCQPGSCPCPPPCRPGSCPCPPVCPLPHPSPCKVPLCERSVLQLISQREGMLWNPSCRLPWKVRSCPERDCRCDERVLTQIPLNPRKTYLLQYTLNIRATAPAKGKIFLKQSPCDVFMDVLPLHFSLERPAGGIQTLQNVSLLHPCTNAGYEVGLSLVLDAKTSVCIEQAAMNIIEL